MNTELMFSSASENWSTPQDFFDTLNAEFSFDLDPAASPENAKCAKYYTREQNGLLQSWFPYRTFVNPPYGRTATGQWVKKAYDEWHRGALVVMLLPARTDTAWFHNWVYGRAEIRFLRGRLKFGGSKNAAPFPSLLAIFNPAKPLSQPRHD